MDYNLFVAPDFVTGAGSGIIYVDNNDLRSFSQILDNVWPVPKVIQWADGGVFYVNSEVGVRAGYLTPAQWEATGVASGDVYDNVVLPTGKFEVTLDGFTAGSDVGAAAPAEPTTTTSSTGSSGSKGSSAGAQTAPTPAPTKP
jgi:hypothetical protein